jgi:hypothetical protein
LGLRTRWIAICIGAMTLACWSACDRITSALDTGPTLTPEELPTQGTTPLPSLGSPPPDVRLASGGDVRSQFLNKPTGNQSALDIDHAVLKQYMLTMAEIFDSPHPSVMIRADTSASGWFSYGYATLRFPQQEIQRSQGHREVFVYVLPDSSGIKRLNVALLPKTPDAFLAYRKWLLPYVDPDNDDQEMATSLQHKSVQQHTAGMVQICFEWTQLACVGNPGDGWSCTRYYYTVCYWAENTSFMEEGPDGGFGDPSGPPDPCIGNDCGGDTAGAFGCDGDPEAFKDHCGRCVGGNTDREPAIDGMDCDKICDDYGDSFLNRMDVQAEIQRMWNASFGPNSSPLPPDQRNEAVVLVEQYWEEPLSFREIDPLNVSSCHVEVRIIFDRTNQRRAVQAILHTHPFSPGDAIWDQRCVDYHNSLLEPGEVPFELGTLPPYNAYTVSRGDQNIIRQVGKPMYVIDREGIRFINPENPSVYERHFNHCWN